MRALSDPQKTGNVLDPNFFNWKGSLNSQCSGFDPCSACVEAARKNCEGSCLKGLCIRVSFKECNVFMHGMSLNAFHIDMKDINRLCRLLKPREF